MTKYYEKYKYVFYTFNIILIALFVLLNSCTLTKAVNFNYDENTAKSELNYLENNYNYKLVTHSDKVTNQWSKYYIFYNDPNDVYVNSDHSKIILKTNVKLYQMTYDVDLTTFKYSCYNDSTSITLISSGVNNVIESSKIDIKDSNGDIFFQVPVVRPIQAVEELPEMITQETKIIVGTVVGLIGLAILLILLSKRFRALFLG